MQCWHRALVTSLCGLKMPSSNAPVSGAWAASSQSTGCLGPLTAKGAAHAQARLLWECNREACQGCSRHISRVAILAALVLAALMAPPLLATAAATASCLRSTVVTTLNASCSSAACCLSLHREKA